MKNPAGKECMYFYGNYFRGRSDEECRLLQSSGQVWTSDLCKFCPVPGITQANACTSMQLRATVGRPFDAAFQKRVRVTAFCSRTNRAVKEPHVGCGECHPLPPVFQVKP